MLLGISKAAMSNYLVSDTLGSLTFINGIPGIPYIDKKILENILRIQSCAEMKVLNSGENEAPSATIGRANIEDWYVILQHLYFH